MRKRSPISLFVSRAAVTAPPDDDRDRTDYQTLFARRDGSVAAPTAGLHFTPALMEALAAAGIATAGVTLHVDDIGNDAELRDVDLLRPP